MIVRNIKQYVLCSQCRKFRYNLGPYQCKQGHIICAYCQPITEVCPQCFIFVDVRDPIRCPTVVDLFMDKIPVPCIYNGCMEKQPRGLIRQHVFVCPFRPGANVNVRNEGTGTAAAGSSVGGAGEQGNENDAAPVLAEDINYQTEETNAGGDGDGHGAENDTEPVSGVVMNDQNEDAVGAAAYPDIRNEHNYAVVLLPEEENDENGSEDAGDGNLSDAETVLVEDTNDQIEGTVGAGGAEGRGSEHEARIAVSAAINEETTGVGSVAIRSEDNYVEVIVLDDDEEDNGGVVDLGNEAEEALDMDVGNVETEGFVAVDLDDTMEIEDLGPNLEADASSVEGGNEMEVLAAEDEVDNGMEVEEINDHDDRMEEEEEEDNNDCSMEAEDIPMEVEALQSCSTRKSSRTRVQTQRYTPPAFKPKATPTGKRKRSLSTPRIRKSSVKRQSKMTRSTSVDDLTAPQPSNTATEEETAKCMICGIQFSRKDNLVKHNERKHQLRRPFQCIICDQKFRQEPHVTNHLASFHSAPLVDRVNGNGETFVVYRCCMFCDNRCIKKNDLRNHISNMHRDRFETGDGN